MLGAHRGLVQRLCSHSKIISLTNRTSQANRLCRAFGLRKQHAPPKPVETFEAKLKAKLHEKDQLPATNPGDVDHTTVLRSKIIGSVKEPKYSSPELIKKVEENINLRGRHFMINGFSNASSDSLISYLCYKILSKPRPTTDREPYGMLVITNSKEQSISVYQHIRNREPSLSVSRLGSISFVAPHVLTARQIEENNNTSSYPAPPEMVSMRNLISSMNWNKLDVLVVSADQLEGVMRATPENKNPYFAAVTRSAGFAAPNPEYVMIMDYEIMFSIIEDIQNLRTVLRHYMGTVKSVNREVNLLRKVSHLLPSSSSLASLPLQKYQKLLRVGSVRT